MPTRRLPRFTMPKVLALTLVACTGPGPKPVADAGPPDGGQPFVDGGPLADGGHANCTNPFPTDGGFGFNCGCCTQECGNPDACGPAEVGSPLCECYV